MRLHRHLHGRHLRHFHRHHLCRVLFGRRRGRQDWLHRLRGGRAVHHRYVLEPHRRTHPAVRYGGRAHLCGRIDDGQRGQYRLERPRSRRSRLPHHRRHELHLFHLLRHRGGFHLLHDHQAVHGRKNMALTAGIVGLPNVGKSTLFNAITKAGAEAANYPFATIDPNVGMVEVPDERLQKLTELITPKKTVPTTFEFTDIAGIVKGASRGEGLGNKFLANIREVDAIVHVVRAFDDENVMREQGREDAFVDPLADIDTINLELILADLESVNKRYARVEKIARTQKDKDSIAEFNVLQKIKPVLEDGKSARTIDFTEDEQKIVKQLFLLTTKPVLYVANVDEDKVANPDDIEYVKQIREFAATENAEVVVISARAEEEISELDDEDKAFFLEDLGLTESGVDKLTRAAYHLLGLGTYFTAGEKEVRAWTFKRGIKAPQAAGIIHSDFERGFIRAITMSYDDLIAYGSEKAVKEAGRLREEGKDYVVQDGDIMEFRFNV